MFNLLNVNWETLKKGIQDGKQTIEHRNFNV